MQKEVEMVQASEELMSGSAGVRGGVRVQGEVEKVQASEEEYVCRAKLRRCGRPRRSTCAERT